MGARLRGLLADEANGRVDIGATRGKLEALGEPFRIRRGPALRSDFFQVFRCECGKVVAVALRKLAIGHTRSCGCLKVDGLIERHQTGKQFPGGLPTRANGRHHKQRWNLTDDERRLHRVWTGMKTRCHGNPSRAARRVYKDRGIAVCDLWRKSYWEFLSWANETGYRRGLAIDRIDPDGNYEPGNCQWLTRVENARKVAVDREKKAASMRARISELEVEVAKWANLSLALILGGTCRASSRG